MADTSQEYTHFMDYWRMIRSRKEVVIAVFLVVVLAGIATTLSLPKVYMASTRILVNQNAPSITPFQYKQPVQVTSIMDMYFLRTQFEIIQSRSILYEVIKTLGLQEHFGRIYSPDGNALSLSETYRMLSDSMRVQQYRDTNLIEIRIYRSSRHSDRDTARRDAARIANEVASVYRESRMKRSREETERALVAMREAYQLQQKKVAEAEAKLEEVRRDLKVSVFSGGQPGSAGSLDNAKLERLESNRISARKEMIDRKTRLEQIQKLQGSDLLYSSAAVIQDPTLSTLRQQLTQSETQLKQKQETFGERHPDVISLQSVVADLKRKIDETLKGQILGLQTDYEIARRGLEAAEADLETAKSSDINAHSERYLPYAKAESEVARQRQIRDTLETRLAQESIELDLPRTPVEVVDVAETPDETEPVSPRVALNIVLSVLLGLACGIGLVFFVEYVDTSVKTVEDIEKHIGAPIVGVIPQRVRPLSEEGGESAHAESYRVLRMNIELSKKLGEGKMLCLTSGGAGEGKSLTLFNLAFVCAQTGKKVLVVDSDMRRPTQHKMFKVPNKTGLAEVLMGTVSLQDAIRPGILPNMDFLPSGKLPSSAHGILNAVRLRDLMDRVRDRYDYVFFDSPPILGVSDASILSSEVDGVLLVIQHRSYPRAVSSRAKAMVENVGGNLLGVALNNLNMTRDYYYYYHSYYYNYSYGNKPRDKKAEKAEKAASAMPQPNAGGGAKAS